MARRQIKIVNKTSWQTRDLRRFVVRAARDYLPEKSFTITFYPAKAEGYCPGRAWLGGYSCRVGLLTEESLAKKRAKYRRRATAAESRGQDRVAEAWRQRADRFQQVSKVGLAQTIAHELAHLDGIDHDKMNESLRELTHRGADWRERFAWAEEFELRHQPPPKKKERLTGLPLAEAKHANCLARIEGWETKEARARNALKKWRKKKRYYEKRMAAFRAML